MQGESIQPSSTGDTDLTVSLCSEDSDAASLGTISPRKPEYEADGRSERCRDRYKVVHGISAGAFAGG